MAVDYKFETDNFGHPLTWADPLNISWSFYSVGQPAEGIFSDALPSNSVFTQDIVNAFAAWSAVANINFVQVADSSASDIRLGWEKIDGPGQILAETYYDFGSNGHLLDADIGFDVKDPWALSGGDEKSQGAPFFITALHEIGHALGLDHYNAQSAVMNAYIDPSLTGLTIHDINGIVALYGAAEVAPVVSAASKSFVHNTTVAASSLFTASDSDGDAIIAYRFEDLSAAAASGHWVVNGVTQAANTAFEVAEADLATVSFVVGTSGSDTLRISASDTTHFGTPASFSIAASNRAPTVTATNQVAAHGQVFTAANLFVANDADGDGIVSYQIADNTAAATSGHWDIAGTNQLANQIITIGAADLGYLTFETGSTSDTLNVRAYDGVAWGAWKAFNVVAPVDHAAVIAATNLSATHGQVFTAAQLFSVSDADGDSIVSYQIADNTAAATSGHWDIAGTDQLAGKIITVAPSDLGTLTFETGSGGDTLNVRAFDGYVWGAWKAFNVVAPVDHAAVIAATNLSATHGQVFTAAQLFSVSDADGDSISSFQIADNTAAATSGHWDIAGTDQLAGKIITVAPGDLGSLIFETGSGGDTLNVRAFDGYVWGAWKAFNVLAPVDHAAVIAATNLSATHGQVFTAGELFGVSDADGDSIVSYRIVDKTVAASSGHWDIAGTDQLAGKTITVAAADLAHLTFESGSGADALSIQAFDGYVWGAAKSFNVVAPLDHAPLATGGAASVVLNSHTIAAALFAVSDADGDVITQYQLQDNSPAASSGHWEIAGVAQPANHPITVAAVDLGNVEFVGGSVPGIDHLFVRGYDDMVWGGWHAFDVQSHV